MRYGNWLMQQNPMKQFFNKYLSAMLMSSLLLKSAKLKQVNNSSSCGNIRIGNSQERRTSPGLPQSPSVQPFLIHRDSISDHSTCHDICESKNGCKNEIVNLRRENKRLKQTNIHLKLEIEKIRQMIQKNKLNTVRALPTSPKNNSPNMLITPDSNTMQSLLSLLQPKSIKGKPVLSLQQKKHSLQDLRQRNNTTYKYNIYQDQPQKSISRGPSPTDQLVKKQYLNGGIMTLLKQETLKPMAKQENLKLMAQKKFSLHIGKVQEPKDEKYMSMMHELFPAMSPIHSECSHYKEESFVVPTLPVSPVLSKRL